MSGTVLISTHRLPLAGALREAFEGERFEVDLVPSLAHLDMAREPELLVLTGEADGEGEEWMRRSRGALGLPVITVLDGARAVRRGEELGAVEQFGPDPDPAEVALVGRRTIERRKLQRLIGIVGESEAIRELLARVVQIAPVDSTVLVTGESGTGKELVARGIHALSHRRGQPFLAVNVAALSETILESELFGHEKGSFTGAIDTRKGFFELAHRGTLFLDEIGEMPLSTQTKLLRVLEQREFMRVGGERAIRTDIRIVAATNQDLRGMVVSGEFRRDLYYRLNILDLRLPPLRERKSDIPLLIQHFIDEVTARMDRPFLGIRPEALELLVEYDWPGNVRELRNLVESMVVLAPGREIERDDIPREVRLPSERHRLLPVHVPSRPRPPSGTRSDGSDLRPELEFVFRTLVDLRVDMEDLRREFEAYREELDDRVTSRELRVSSHTGPGPGPMVIQAPGAHDPGNASPPRLEEDVAGASAVDAGRDGRSGDAADPEGSLLYRPGMTMEDVEERAIRLVLEEVGGNRRKAAESLGIGERTLYRKIRKYNIDV